NLWRIKILAQWCRSRHDEPPGFAMLNLTRLHLGIAHESQFQGLGITCGTLARAQEKTIRTRTPRVDISIKGRAFAMCFTQQSGPYYQMRTRSRFTYSANRQKKCSSIFWRMKG